MTFFQNPEKNIIFIETFINQKSPTVQRNNARKVVKKHFLLEKQNFSTGGPHFMAPQS
jgi:hypothetical protein